MNVKNRSLSSWIAHTWIEEGWSQGNADMVYELHSSSFVDHDSAGRPNDREGFRKGIIDLYRAFPDLHCIVDDLVIDEETGTVSIRWSGTGTHRGTFLGTEPTGRRIAFSGIEIIRITDGLITERWGQWDGLSLLEQMGRL
jgi:steroid delta-isomerase-like uncharacterized protein